MIARIILHFPLIRNDQTFSIKKNGKKSLNLLQENLQPRGLVFHRDWLEGSTSLDIGRYLKKPHGTVEEASAPTCNTCDSMYFYDCPDK